MNKTHYHRWKIVANGRRTLEDERVSVTRQGIADPGEVYRIVAGLAAGASREVGDMAIVDSMQITVFPPFHQDGEDDGADDLPVRL